MPVTLREVGARLGEQTSQPSRRLVTIIQAGWGSSGYYSGAVLERDGPSAFPAGTQMYLDHPSRTEESDRPERSVRDLAGRIATTPRMEGGALVAEAEIFEVWRPVIDSIAGDIGLSIRALGETEQGEADGRSGPIVTALTEGISVDFVTKAGAGGKVGALIESARDQQLSEAECEALYEALLERQVSKDERVALAKKGQAIPVKDSDGNIVDGRYPMANCSDVANAARAIGRAKGDAGQVKAFIQRVASKLSCSVPFKSTESARLAEARNVGHYFESRIHRAFTEAADDHFGQGHLTRPERIAMSGAIGDALDAFSESLTKSAPQLYQRDIYADPEAGGTTVSEAAAGRTTKEATVADDDRLAKLEETVSTIQTKLAEAETARDEAITRAERAEDKALMLEARQHIAEAFAKTDATDDWEPLPELPERARKRVSESALSGQLPTKEDGGLDTDKLLERVRKAAKEERDYLGEASTAGRVTDMGPSRARGGGVSDDDLAEAFKRLGSTDSAAKLAVNGR